MRSRGATSWPRSASASASSAASVAARSWTAGQPAPPSTSSPAIAAAIVSSDWAEASWRAAPAWGTASRPALASTRFRYVGPLAGRRSIHVGRDPQHARADRAAEPLLAGAGVEAAAQRRHVERDRADALGAVEQDGHVAEVRQALHDAAVDPADVRAGDELRPRPDRLGDLRERRDAQRDPALVAGGRERSLQAGVLLVGGHDLVAGLQVERVEHAHDALARARRQRDVVGGGADQLRVGLAQARARVEHRAEVGVGAAARRPPARARLRSRARRRRAAARTCRR